MRGGGRGAAKRMASSRVMPSSSPSHTASDLARFAQAASRPGGGGGSGLGSMNVEELLRGIYSEMPTPATPAPAADRPMPPAPAPAPGIASRKTAEQVWKEITAGGGSGGAAAPVVEAVIPAGAGGGADGPEMTLEDFLAREGAVKEDEVRVPGPSAPAEGQMVLGFLGGAEGVGVAGGGGGRGRKRQLMDPVDRAAMQRQKRMIKNRESAARSRERKQVGAPLLHFLHN